MAFGIPNIERIVSNFLEGGTGITAIRSLEVEKKFLWTVDFPGKGISSQGSYNPYFAPPSPFNDFFPAHDVSLPAYVIESSEYSLPMTSVNYPKRGGAKQMTISFYDDQDRTLFKWFKDWVDIDILNAGQFISGLEDQHVSVIPTLAEKENRPVHPYRTVRVAMLQAYRKEAIAFEFGVVPSGSMDWSGDQSSEANMLNVTFDIVADSTYGKLKKTGLQAQIFKEIKNIIGRFI